MIIYHITTSADWATAQILGSYQADTLAEEGFIHCSTRQQVTAVANRFYSGRQDLVLLSIDTEEMNVPVKWENLEGGEDLFPHIYGPLDLKAVTQVLDFRTDSNGLFGLPEELLNPGDDPRKS